MSPLLTFDERQRRFKRAQQYIEKYRQLQTLALKDKQSKKNKPTWVFRDNEQVMKEVQEKVKRLLGYEV